MTPNEPNLPPPNRIPESLTDRRIHRIIEHGVGSWCPTPDGSGPATAVVFHFKFEMVAGGTLEAGLRLKSARAVNELIAMLERHRNDVWPQGDR